MDSLINEVLGKDTTIVVLSLLDTPSDLARVACVCSSWHKYVIEGELWKRMCLKTFPELGNDFKCLSSGGLSEDLCRVQLNGYTHFESKELQISTHTCRLLLRKLLVPPLHRTCIAEPVHASSTDNLPFESVTHTLYPEPAYSSLNHSYWSSKGEMNTSIPEMLTYRLVSELCVVYSIKIHPFLASFQEGNPIYSSEMVRFRLGYSQSEKPHWDGLFQCLSGKETMDEYVWTYVSPAFPMAQEDVLQTFQLPKPVLCIGGILQVEFMGRVQTQSIDGLYYICVSHVYVTGRPILGFTLEGLGDKGQFVLRHLNDKSSHSNQSSSHLILNKRIQEISLAFQNRSVMSVFLRYLLSEGLLNDLGEDEANLVDR